MADMGLPRISEIRAPFGTVVVVGTNHGALTVSRTARELLLMGCAAGVALGVTLLLGVGFFLLVCLIGGFWMFRIPKNPEVVSAGGDPLLKTLIGLASCAVLTAVPPLLARAFRETTLCERSGVRCAVGKVCAPKEAACIAPGSCDDGNLGEGCGGGARNALLPRPERASGKPEDASPPVGPAPLCPEGMVEVPAGRFQMGSPAGVGDDDEHPSREVTLLGYCIDRTEVTVQAYVACVAAKACSAAPLTVEWPQLSEVSAKLYSTLCNRADHPDHPINCIDWDQARAYCKYADKRLPTEAEWEYAARGTDGRVYPWGNEPPTAERAAFNIAGTRPVGNLPKGASPFGVLDMAGNVWEWTADWYEVYKEFPVMNLVGPDTGSSRVLRGGGWGFYDLGNLRAAHRIWMAASDRDSIVGFRCARGD